MLQHSCRCTMIWLDHMAVIACAIFVCSGCCQRDQLPKIRLSAILCPCVRPLPGTSEGLAMPAQSFTSAAPSSAAVCSRDAMQHPGLQDLCRCGAAQNMPASYTFPAF